MTRSGIGAAAHSLLKRTSLVTPRKQSQLCASSNGITDVVVFRFPILGPSRWPRLGNLGGLDERASRMITSRTARRIGQGVTLFLTLHRLQSEDVEVVVPIQTRTFLKTPIQ